MKRMLAIALCVLLLCTALLCPASAYTAEELNVADALFHLRLFLGMGETYALDQPLTREQGVTLVVRMLGHEQIAQKGGWAHPFTDVNEWAQNYVGYAFSTGLTNGVSPTTFAGTSPMTDQMFMTFCLRALGYSDSGANAEFAWNASTKFAESKKVISDGTPKAVFTRGDAVRAFWSVLSAELKNGGRTLAEDLIARGVFSLEEYLRAAEIAAFGLDSGDASGEAKPEIELSDPTGGSTEMEELPDHTEDPKPDGVTYEQFKAMTPAERSAIKAQFATAKEYMAWLEQIRAAHEASRNIIVVGDGDVSSM